MKPMRGIGFKIEAARSGIVAADTGPRGFGNA
jgi:hypothetical protein